MVQVAPRVQVCPFTVVAGFTRPALGIEAFVMWEPFGTVGLGYVLPKSPPAAPVGGAPPVVVATATPLTYSAPALSVPAPLSPPVTVDGTVTPPSCSKRSVSARVAVAFKVVATSQYVPFAPTAQFCAA